MKWLNIFLLLTLLLFASADHTSSSKNSATVATPVQGVDTSAKATKRHLKTRDPDDEERNLVAENLISRFYHLGGKLLIPTQYSRVSTEEGLAKLWTTCEEEMGNVIKFKKNGHREVDAAAVRQLFGSGEFAKWVSANEGFELRMVKGLINLFGANEIIHIFAALKSNEGHLTTQGKTWLKWLYKYWETEPVYQGKVILLFNGMRRDQIPEFLRKDLRDGKKPMAQGGGKWGEGTSSVHARRS